MIRLTEIALRNKSIVILISFAIFLICWAVGRRGRVTHAD